MLERGVGSGAAKNAIRNARLTGSRTKTERRPHFFRCLLLSQLAPLRAGTPAAAGGLALPIASTLGSTLATDGARRVGGDVTGCCCGGRLFRPEIHVGCFALRLLTSGGARRWRRSGCLGRRAATAGQAWRRAHPAPAWAVTAWAGCRAGRSPRRACCAAAARRASSSSSCRDQRATACSLASTGDPHHSSPGGIAPVHGRLACRASGLGCTLRTFTRAPHAARYRRLFLHLHLHLLAGCSSSCCRRGGGGCPRCAGRSRTRSRSASASYHTPRSSSARTATRRSSHSARRT